MAQTYSLRMVLINKVSSKKVLIYCLPQKTWLFTISIDHLFLACRRRDKRRRDEGDASDKDRDSKKTREVLRFSLYFLEKLGWFCLLDSYNPLLHCIYCINI